MHLPAVPGAPSLPATQAKAGVGENPHQLAAATDTLARR